MAAKDTFVPFLASVGLNPPKASGSGQFIPVASETPAAPRDPAPVAPKAHAHGESKITLQKDGDVVTHIRVECPCGLVTEVKCVY